MYNVYLTGIHGTQYTPSLKNIMAERFDSFDDFNEARKFMINHPDTNKKIILIDTEVGALYQLFNGGMVYIGASKAAIVEQN